MPTNEEEKIIPIGGQAVIEGVLMRSPKAYALAIRKPDGQIIIEKKDEASWNKRNWIFSLPIIRGFITLAESLTLGLHAITVSANYSLEGEGKGQKISPMEMGFSMLLSFGLAILLFFFIPASIFTLLKDSGINLVLLNLIEGTVRISIFLLFIMAISLMPDMKRIFEYHGAEHKIVHLFQEKNTIEGLTVEDAKKFSPAHPSCGTSFLLIVFITSILVFSFLGRPGLIERVALKIVLLPLIAGISYEIIRIARKKDAPQIMKILTMPGLWLQKLTTREPSQDQLEVALEALKNAVR